MPLILFTCGKGQRNPEMINSDWIEDGLYPALISIKWLVWEKEQVWETHILPCPAEFCMDKNIVWIDNIFSVYVYWDKTLDVQDQLCNFCAAIFINSMYLSIIYHMISLMSISIMLYWRFNFFLVLCFMYLAH